VKDFNQDHAKKVSRTKKTPDVAATIAAVYGCKWSLKIFDAIERGFCRPGAMEKALPGLSTRVQSYYFKRMIDLGVLRKNVYPEVPPRVEYAITTYGLDILKIFHDIKVLQAKLERDVENAR
jgi:DNA-binding HxlR family transcriptional regulator